MQDSLQLMLREQQGFTIPIMRVKPKQQRKSGRWRKMAMAGLLSFFYPNYTTNPRPVQESKEKKSDFPEGSEFPHEIPLQIPLWNLLWEFTAFLLTQEQQSDIIKSDIIKKTFYSEGESNET